MNIMFASHTYMGGPFVVGSHHLAREMKKLGHSVIHVSTPLSPFHLLKLKDHDIRERFRIWSGKKSVKQAGVVNEVPLSWLPWEIAGPIFKKNGKNWMLPSMSPILKENNMPSVDILFIDQPRFVGLSKLVDSKITIYRPTDLYSNMTGNNTIAAAEEALLGQVDGLVSTSDPVLKELMAYNPLIPTLLLENGVEYDHFSQSKSVPAEYAEIPGPRAVYVGAIDQRLDIQALCLLAEQMPNISVVIIGPTNAAAIEHFSRFKNVHLLGSRDYSVIPDYLHHSDVALLPLSNHSANRGRSPMKLYEYAAAGLPVVVTETPELLRRDEKFLYFYTDPNEFPSRVQEALSQAQDKEKVRTLAKTHAWNSKVVTLLDFVKKLG